MVNYDYYKACISNGRKHVKRLWILIQGWSRGLGVLGQSRGLGPTPQEQEATETMHADSTSWVLDYLGDHLVKRICY